MKNLKQITLYIIGLMTLMAASIQAQQTSNQDIIVSTENQNFFNTSAINPLEEKIFFLDPGVDEFETTSVDPFTLPSETIDVLNTDVIGTLNDILNTLGLDPIAPITSGKFGPELDIKVGFDFNMYFRYLLSSGDVDIDYPIKANFTYPDDQSFGCGDFVKIETERITTSDGFVMNLQEPIAEFALGSKINPGLHISASICAFDCTSAFSSTEPAGFDAATSANHESLLGGDDYDFLGVSTTDGIQFPWDYSSIIPNPGVPALTLPILSSSIPGDPLGNLANISGLIDNPFRDLDAGDQVINGDMISSSIDNTFLEIDFDPIQFQEYVTGVPLTISQSVGPLSVNGTILSLPFGIDMTQKHEFEFTADDIQVDLQFSNQVNWMEKTPDGTLVDENFGTYINDFTLGNDLFVQSGSQLTITPKYTISENTFTYKILEEIQFSWTTKILELAVNFPPITADEICDDIIAGLNLPTIEIPDFESPIYCNCIDDPFDPAYNPLQIPGCIASGGVNWVCDYNNISLEDAFRDLCTGLFTSINSGSLILGPLVDETVNIGDPITIPVEENTFEMGGFNFTDGESFDLIPNQNSFAPAFVTTFQKMDAQALTIDINDILPDMTGIVSASMTPTTLSINNCAQIGQTQFVTVSLETCGFEDYELEIQIEDVMPPSCTHINAITNVTANEIVTVEDLWTESADDGCWIDFSASTVTPDLFICPANGPMSVSLVLKDKFGNTSNCNKQVNVTGSGSATYVDVNAPSGGDGSSWTSAFTDLQDAIANACVGGSIYMAEGTYYPTLGSDQTINFHIDRSLNIYGGFSPSNGVTEFAQRDWSLYPTILSGDIDGDNMMDADNSQSVLYVTATSTFSGLIVEHGYADGTVAPHHRGGAVYNANSSSTYDKCIFRNNWAIYGGVMYDIGGFPKFTNCLFYDNEAGTNASVFWTSTGQVQFLHCTITENTSPVTAISGFNSSGNLIIIGSILWNNGGDLECKPGIDYELYFTSLEDDSSIQLCAQTSLVYFNQDPGFSDPTNDDFTLLMNSFAVDKGDIEEVPQLGNVDLGNNVRLFQSSTDLGAFEYGCGLPGPKVVTVTSGSDDPDFPITGSLRSLIKFFICPGDTIKFSAALNGTNINIQEAIELDKDVVIVGNGYSSTTLRGFGDNRFFALPENTSAHIMQLSMENGGAVQGGGIFSEGNLELTDVRLHGNRSFGIGGAAIYIDKGTLKATNTLIVDNSSEQNDNGIGIYLNAGVANLFNTTISKNSFETTNASDPTKGAGLYNAGATLNLYNNVISGNYLVDINDGTEFPSELSGNMNISEGNYIGNVNFVSNSNFNLADTEPAINRGENEYVVLTKDISGAPRISDGTVEPGAFEKAPCMPIHSNRYVDKSVAINGNGLTPTTAFKDLPSALSELRSLDCSAVVDTIFIAWGAYGNTGENIDDYMVLDVPVVLYGGYSPGFAARPGDTWLSGYGHHAALKITADVELNGVTMRNGSALETTVNIGTTPIEHYAGGGIINESDSRFINCGFQECKAWIGGGFYNVSGDPYFENCMFYLNEAKIPDGGTGGINGGGAIYFAEGNFKMIHCTFTQNPSEEGHAAIEYPINGQGEIYNSIIWEEDITPLLINQGASIIANNNLISTPVLIGSFSQQESNIYGIDPLFNAPFDQFATKNSFAISKCSPAANAGDISYSGLDAFDAFFEPRLIDAIVDIGAQEVTNSFTNPRTLTFVDGSVIASGDGSSWATALKTVGEAFDLNLGCPGDTVFLAEGTYFDNFLVRSNVVLLGGYPSGGGERNWGQHPTIINGSNNGGVIRINGSRLEVNGLTIENGNGPFGGGFDNRGELFVYNCIIKENNTSSNSNGGGGIFHTGRALEIVNTLLYGNTAKEKGAALHVVGAALATNDPTRIINCTFVDNLSTDENGALFFAGNSTTTIDNSIMWNANESEIVNFASEDVIVTNSTIQGSFPGNVTNGGGNQSLDPIFLDAANNDYSLMPCSPAIDKGLSPLDYVEFPFDVEGNNRSIFLAYDMGAIEFQGVPNIDPVPTSIYVDKNAPAGGDGLSWATAFNELYQTKAKIDDAFDCQAVSEIHVAEGTYYPTDGADETIAFVFDTDVAIYGGYSPNNGVTAFEDRNWKLYPTILSGDIDQDGILDTDNSLSIMELYGDAIIEGFIFEYGYADIDQSAPPGRGGAIFLEFSDATIQNCIFRDNYARIGGAVYLRQGDPTFINCLFYDNEALQESGALSASTNSNASMRNCTITENTAPANRYAIRIAFTPNMSFMNCIFHNNIGGDLSCYSGGSGTIDFCSFEDASLSTCIIEGEGNILGSNPLFIDPTNDNFGISSCSPGYQSGDLAPGTTYDLARNQRVFAGVVDRGAYEYQGASTTTDEVVDLICAGDSVLLGGVWRFAPYTYSELIDGVVCANLVDTIRTHYLTEKPVARTTIFAAVCNFDQTGVQVDTIFGGAANGCDTITTTINTYDPLDPVYFYTEACHFEDESVVKDTLFGGASNGCDSINIFVNKIYRPAIIEVDLICGDSIFLDSAFQTEPGNYSEVLIDASGCDSIIAHRINVISLDHYYVDAFASGDQNGHDWMNAFADLQSALQNECLKSGDSIFVAEGMYYPDAGVQSIDNDRDASFEIPEGVTVLGGYPSGGGPRNLALNATLLSGDLEQNDLKMLPESASDIVGSNAYTVVYMNGGELNGFTILAGYSDGTDILTGRQQRGAGIFNTGSSIVKQCRILGNYAPGENDDGLGGGIFNSNGNAQYSNCLVARNHANGSGGGFYCDFGEVKLVNNTIAYNTDGGIQGGIAGASADVEFQNSIIWGNDEQAIVIGTGTMLFGANLLAGGLPQSPQYSDDGMIFTKDEDPLFTDPTTNDFRVDPCLSPANDGGRNDVVTDDTDLEGDVRIQNGTADIGVFENAGANDLMVTTTLNDGFGSLRRIIAEICAEKNVIFDAALMGDTIQLSGSEIVLDKNLNILGLGMDQLYISGKDNSRIFKIEPGNAIKLEDINLIEGHPTDGVILNQGVLEIKDVKVEK